MLLDLAKQNVQFSDEYQKSYIIQNYFSIFSDAKVYEITKLTSQIVDPIDIATEITVYKRY